MMPCVAATYNSSGQVGVLNIVFSSGNKHRRDCRVCTPVTPCSWWDFRYNLEHIQLEKITNFSKSDLKSLSFLPSRTPNIYLFKKKTSELNWLCMSKVVPGTRSTFKLLVNTTTRYQDIFFFPTKLMQELDSLTHLLHSSLIAQVKKTG